MYKHLIFMLLILVSSNSKEFKKGEQKQKNLEFEFKHRNSELTTEEKKLINNVGLNEKYFRSLFSKIIISEINSNSYLKNRSDRKIRNGILFYGLKIDLDNYKKLKLELKKTNLELETSLNYASDRWIDFKFPFYKDRNTVIDIDKQIYKIYRSSDGLDFIEQIEFVYHDKEIVKNVYEDWKIKYNVIPIWADNRDNILMINTAITEELILDIFEGKRKCFPNIDRNISLGWETKDTKISQIRERLPLIDMFFYDE